MAGTLTGQTVSIAQGAVTRDVTGSFTTPYQVAATPSWATTVDVIQKTASQFTLQFNVPAPLGATVDYFIVTPTSPAGVGPAILAGDLITNVRWKIPDPVLDANGNPNPDGNGGIFPASALYGWLDDGIRELSRLIGSQIEDWTAIAQTNLQPWYDVDPHFQALEGGFSLQWPLDIISLTELDTIWPAAAPTGQSTSQSLWGYIRRRTNALQFGLWPTPNQTDPVTTITAALGTSPNTTIQLADPTNFLSFGYVLIDQEIIAYQNLAGSVLSVLSRGVCGTTPAPHLINAACQQLGLWLKGVRTPARVSSALSPVELPQDLVQVVKLYVLAQCRESENEGDRADKLMAQFNRACAEIRADPFRVQQTGLANAYGSPRIGPIYFPQGGGVIVP